VSLQVPLLRAFLAVPDDDRIDPLCELPALAPHHLGQADLALRSDERQNFIVHLDRRVPGRVFTEDLQPPMQIGQKLDRASTSDYAATGALDDPACSPSPGTPRATQ
jgi:thiamine monophosphate kinase